MTTQMINVQADRAALRDTFRERHAAAGAYAAQARAEIEANLATAERAWKRADPVEREHLKRRLEKAKADAKEAIAELDRMVKGAERDMRAAAIEVTTVTARLDELRRAHA